MSNKFQVNYEDNSFDYVIKKRKIPPFMIVIIVMLCLIIIALGLLIIKNIFGVLGNGMNVTGDGDSIFADYSNTIQYEQDYDGNSLKESVSNDVTWQLSAIDLICNYKNKAEGFKCEEGFFFYLIDITNDGVPEVFQGPVSDSGKYFEIFSFYYWNGEAYIKGAIDTESKSVHCFLPFKTTSDNTVVFWDHVIPDDYKFHMNNIGYYANSGRIAFDNGRLFYEENIDRSACVDAILDAEQSSEDQADEGQFDEEQATYVDPGFVAYKTEFDSKYYKIQDVHRAYYGYWGDVNSDEELYAEIITREEAKRVIESYLNNDISGHFD